MMEEMNNSGSDDDYFDITDFLESGITFIFQSIIIGVAVYEAATGMMTSGFGGLFTGLMMGLFKGVFYGLASLMFILPICMIIFIVYMVIAFIIEICS
ncbi:hypothetical protein [Neisseria dentiae]|uniref:hypothetical protein n=2 Tax=Neisseria dentiae TaxID=194197 RepID=UPI0035A127AB